METTVGPGHRIERTSRSMSTVLVVDDEFGIGETLHAVLGDFGHRVLLALNGREALQRLAEEPVDLILSDYMMPVMDGAALLAAVRANPRYRAIPFVVICALPQTLLRGTLEGYDDFLQKPFRMIQIVDLVDRWTKRAG